MRRQMSFLSAWTSTDSLYPPTTVGGLHHHHHRDRLTFAAVVGHAQHQKMAFNKQVQPPLKGAKAFKAVAHSVLSPANRKFMEAQREKAEQKEEERKIILGGETFKVNEDLNVIAEVEEEGLDDDLNEEVRLRAQQMPLKISPASHPILTKRDSSMSLASSCSVDSDWSDEELEELERILDDIQGRSEAAEQRENLPQRKASAQERWKKLKHSRLLAMQRLKLVKRLSSSSSLDMDSSVDSFHTADDGTANSSVIDAVSFFLFQILVAAVQFTVSFI